MQAIAWEKYGYFWQQSKVWFTYNSIFLYDNWFVVFTGIVWACVLFFEFTAPELIFFFLLVFLPFMYYVLHIDNMFV